MTLLDRAIASLSPEWALKRQRARNAMSMLERAYDGAKTGRRTGGWVANSTSSDAEIAGSINRLRDRSRDIVRNNPYGQRAQDIFSTNVVGTGIIAKANGAQEAWDTWCRQCDADGLLDFYGIQALVARTLFESGECLIRLRERRPEDGMNVPLVLQVLEPDHLDTRRTGAVAGGGWVKQGIEYDAIGRRVAYWLFNHHPGDIATTGQTLTSSRAAAADVLHIFERKRPGQNRGVPRLASVLLKMRDLDDYEEAELVRKGIESCFAAFVTTEDDGQTLGQSSTDSADRRIENLSAGMVQYLKPGQDITFGAPQNSGGYADYTKTQLRAIAAGVGITYEQLTGDLSGVNYSSIRAGMVEFHRSVDAVQWLTLVPMLLDPVWARWSAMAYGLRVIKQPAGPVRWTPPRRQWVDPLKDVNAARQEIGAGITSLSETIRSRGEDPEKVFAEIAAERATLARLGIVSDAIAEPPSDPVEPPDDPMQEEQKKATVELLRAQVTRELAQSRAALAPAPAPEYHFHAGDTHVAPAEIRNEIRMPDQPAPEVTVTNEIYERDMPAPVVNVSNEIHEREQPAPIINVAPAAVTVENIMPDEIKTTIASMPDRVTTSSIERDKTGNITKTTQTERDA
jgi:lambda family phage portal protein